MGLEAFVRLAREQGASDIHLEGGMPLALRIRGALRLVGDAVPAPELGSTPVKSLVRQGLFFKLASAIETGAADGAWTFMRYAEWLNRKTDWHLPSRRGRRLRHPGGGGRSLGHHPPARARWIPNPGVVPWKSQRGAARALAVRRPDHHGLRSDLHCAQELAVFLGQ